MPIEEERTNEIGFWLVIVHSYTKSTMLHVRATINQGAGGRGEKVDIAHFGGISPKCPT